MICNESCLDTLPSSALNRREAANPFHKTRNYEARKTNVQLSNGISSHNYIYAFAVGGLIGKTDVAKDTIEDQLTDDRKYSGNLITIIP